MTAFNIESLLLLALAFLAGLALGVFLARRRRPGAEEVAPARAGTPAATRPAIAADGGGGTAVAQPPASFAPAIPREASAPQRPEAKPPEEAAVPPEPDLFTRLLASAPPLPPEDDFLHDPPPPRPPPPPPSPAVLRERPAGEPHPGSRPPTLPAPEGEGPDDLKLLKGIGPQNERRLHALGIFHFRQIAAWTPEEAVWVGSYLAFPGRIEREDWIGQARALTDGAPPPEGMGRRKR